MDLKFTRLQAKAIMKFLITFAQEKDEIKDDDHAQYLMQLKQKMECTNLDLSEAYQMNTPEAMLILKNLSSDSKTVVGYVFHQMMELDGPNYKDKYKNIKILFSGIGISTF